MLVPEKLKSLMSGGFIFGEKFAVLPFSWDPEKKRAKLSDSIWRKLCWQSSIFFTVFGSLVLTWRVSRDWNCGYIKNDPRLRYHCLFLVLAGWSFLYYETCLVVTYKQVPQFFNTIMDYMEYFERTFRNSKRNPPNQRIKALTHILAINYYSVHLGLILQTAYVLIEPNHPAKILPQNLFDGSPSGVIITLNVLGLLLLSIYVDGVLCSNAFLWATGFLPVVVLLENISHEMRRIEGKTKYWTRDILRYSGAFYAVTSQLHILMAHLLDLVSPILTFVPMSLTLGMICTAVQTIKAVESSQKIQALSIFLQLLSIHYFMNRLVGRFTDEVNKNTVEFLKGEAAGGRRVAKSLKALKPMSVHVFSLFTLGTPMALSGIQLVLDNVASALAANPG